MYSSIDEHISSFPKEKQEILVKIRKTIHEACPEAIEAMSYGVPAFKLKNKDVALYAAFKKHIGFYPTPKVIDAFEKETKLYRTGKGTLQFPLEKPIPWDLIKKMVRYRENEITS